MHTCIQCSVGNTANTLVLTYRGGIFAWGCSAFGCLGIGHVTDAEHGISRAAVQNTPAYVPLETRARAISAGEYHSVALMDEVRSLPSYVCVCAVIPQVDACHLMMYSSERYTHKAGKPATCLHCCKTPFACACIWMWMCMHMHMDVDMEWLLIEVMNILRAGRSILLGQGH
jgi:hypothetical protein